MKVTDPVSVPTLLIVDPAGATILPTGVAKFEESFRANGIKSGFYITLN